MKQTLKINRFGVLVASEHSANQCKAINHTHYEYQVSAVCDTKLDTDGYVINHIEIDAAIQTAFHQGMSSCEDLLMRIVDAVENLMKVRGVKVFELYGKLKPILAVPTMEYAFMEMHRKLK